MKNEEIIKMLDSVDGIAQFAFVGSRVTCNPPVENTDIDVICLFHNGKLESFDFESIGFEYDGDESYEMYQGEFGFASYSNSSTKVNLVCTEDIDFYNRFLAASSVAKRLNLTNKEDRVALFQAVVWGCHDEANRIVPIHNFMNLRSFKI